MNISMKHMCESSGTSQDLVPSFYHMTFRDESQVGQAANKCVSTLTHLENPNLFLNWDM